MSNRRSWPAYLSGNESQGPCSQRSQWGSEGNEGSAHYPHWGGGRRGWAKLSFSRFRCLCLSVCLCIPESPVFVALAPNSDKEVVSNGDAGHRLVRRSSAGGGQEGEFEFGVPWHAEQQGAAEEPWGGGQACRGDGGSEGGHQPEEEGGDRGEGQAGVGRRLPGGGHQVCRPVRQGVSAAQEKLARGHHAYGRQEQARR